MNHETAATIIKRRLHSRIVKKAYKNYTGNGSGYMNIVMGVVTPIHIPGFAHPMHPMHNKTSKAYFEAMRRHAKKFPRTVPTLYRGIKAANQRTIAMISNFMKRPNKSHHYPTFLSFSTNRNIANVFRGGNNGYILTLNKGTYPAIRNNRYTPAQIKKEKEVTLAPGIYTMLRKTKNGFNVSYTPNK